jgi:hypothetical protein
MKQISTIIIGLVTMLCIVGCGQQQEKIIEENVANSPANTTVKIENDYVKVIEFMLKPGDKLSLHKGGQRAIYSLSDYKLKWTEGDQETEKEWTKGQAHWHNAIEHAAENIGETDANYLVVTRKEMALPETDDYDIEQDASEFDSEHANIIFENEYVRIIEVKLAAGESQTMHHGINRVIYSLTSYQIKFISDKMEPMDTKIETGDAHWHTADKHAVENIGETLAHYLIFEFKQ